MSYRNDEAVTRGRPRDLELDRRITAAVLEVLGEQGYEGITFEAVARRCQASRASLYRRWRTKRDMVLAAVKDGPARKESEPLGHGACLGDDLLALARRLARTMCAADTGTALMLLQAGLEDPDLCDAIEEGVGPTGARLPRSVIDAAVRAGLDHPEAVTFLGILDVLPTLDTWAVLQGVHAKVAWHLYLMAQPAGMPERMIAAVAPEFYAPFLDAWDPTGTTFTPQERDHYVESSIASTDSIVADYRASAGVDLDMDTADRERGAQLTMPVAVISQDWGAQLGFDASALWRAWAPDVTYQATTSGHFMAEENPQEITDFIEDLARRAIDRH